MKYSHQMFYIDKRELKSPIQILTALFYSTTSQSEIRSKPYIFWSNHVIWATGPKMEGRPRKATHGVSGKDWPSWKTQFKTDAAPIVWPCLDLGGLATRKFQKWLFLFGCCLKNDILNTQKHRIEVFLRCSQGNNSLDRPTVMSQHRQST